MELKEANLIVSMRSFKNKLAYSNELIEFSFENSKSQYVACSFGKDSSVMLDLITKHNPNVKVAFVEYEETPYLDRYEDLIKIWNLRNLERVFIGSSIMEDICEGDVLSNKFSHIDLAFVGIRKDESKKRFYSLTKHGDFAKLKIQKRSCPLSNWTTDEIAAYTLSNGLPMLMAYEKFGFSERTVSGIAPDLFGFRSDQLRRLKQMDISRYNLILIKWPELANLV